MSHYNASMAHLEVDTPYVIALDGQALAGDRPTGLGRVARALHHALQQIPDIQTLPLMPASPDGFSSAPQRLLWEQVQLPSKMAESGAALLHSPAFGCPFLGRFPRVLTVHDLLPRTHAYETGASRGASWYWARYLPGTAIHASAVITNSRQTRTELCREIPVDPARVFPLPLGAPWESGDLIAIDAYETWAAQRPSDPYLLMVGSLVPRKQPATLLRALGTLRDFGISVPVCIVGEGEPHGAQLRRLASDLGIDDQVTWLGYVADDALLHAIYAGALAVVCPSGGEGFDLPAVEACCAGVPVVASSLEVHREVLGPAGRYFPVGNHKALAGMLSDLIRDPVARDAAAAEATICGARYAWRHHAAGAALLYRCLIDRVPLPDPMDLHAWVRAGAEGDPPQGSASHGRRVPWIVGSA